VLLHHASSNRCSLLRVALWVSVSLLDALRGLSSCLGDRSCTYAVVPTRARTAKDLVVVKKSFSGGLID
jgi:dissimilatory sulfite reductase (desulfoviridin) alpha/beta subunit